MSKEKIEMEDGSTYEGETADGKPHGKGKWHTPMAKQNKEHGMTKTMYL